MKGDQAEQMHFLIGPGEGQFTLPRQLSHIDTISRHTADSFFREHTGRTLHLLTGIAQGAATIAQAKALHACPAKLIHQLQHGSVQFISG